jgi:flagellar M-ring protein FliF
MATSDNVAQHALGFAGLRPLMLLVGIALAMAAGVAVMLWWQGPNWSLLYGNLAASDASQVAQSLAASGIKYKINEANGAIMVPAEKVHEARLQLASQGLPESSSTGVDLISRESGIGTSQFMETARYQYALETELARTISTLRSVEAARVHLAMPQQSAFIRDRRPVTASVLVQLRAGGRLEQGQVQAIVHLVASSIPELNAESVTVVDQAGHLLSSNSGAASAAANEQIEAVQRVEESYVQRIEQLLQPLMGVGNVRAQVAVDMEATESEQAREQYAPGSAIVRSEQLAEQNSAQQPGAGTSGVPGSLTNQPPTGGTVAALAPPGAGPAAASTPAAGANVGANANAAAGAAAAANAAVTGNSSRQSTRNFEIDRTLSYSKQPGGRIKRVSVAVLLDNVRKKGADGKETVEPLAAAQIADITKLVKNAVGFDEARGDSVSVVSAAFRVDAEQLTPESVPIWQKPMVQEIGRLVLGALVLLAIALGVLRPMIRNLTAQSVVPMAALADSAGGAGGEGVAMMAAPGGQPLGYEQQLVQAKNMVAQDPKRVAQVVKSWAGEK